MALGGACDDLLNGEPCDNISGKNKSFCEMTVVYWAWKNIKKLCPSLEYIGVNHYRRYFSFDRNALFSIYINESEDAVREYRLNLGKLESILSTHDAVLAKPSVLPNSLDVDYGFSDAHNLSDLTTLKKIVHNKCPEYDRAMFNVMTRGNKISYGNMCIMSWRDFDTYCAWLFDILFECERQIDIPAYTAKQRRIFGYMAEYLLNAWVAHRGLKAKCLARLLFAGKPNRSALYNALHRTRCSLAFLFAKPWRKFSPGRYAAMLKHCEDELERMK